MKIADCQVLFTSALSTTSISAPVSTHYNHLAASVLEMARAYESDGITFLNAGDPVNALASFYYGSGWLHFGLSSGLLTTAHPPGCLFRETQEMLEAPFRPKLEEKTSRYAHLLKIARKSVRYAPDPATTGHDFAQRILCITGIYARHGDFLADTGNLEAALASFSYGHGWLDAAVTCGFFRVVADRDLFTV